MPLKNLIAIALVSAVGGLGTFLLKGVPSVQTSSFAVIICGSLFGPAAGAASGIVTAALSGLLNGIGPWTPWQLIAWELMGVGAAYLKGKKTYIVIIYGALSGYLFGVFMNIWFLAYSGFTLGKFLAACVASAKFDLAHAATNAALLFLLPPRRFENILNSFNKEK